MTPLWLLRAKRWAGRPPSAARVTLVIAVVAACIALFAVERVAGWPDRLTPDRTGRVLR